MDKKLSIVRVIILKAHHDVIVPEISYFFWARKIGINPVFFRERVGRVFGVDNGTVGGPSERFAIASLVVLHQLPIVVSLRCV